MPNYLKRRYNHEFRSKQECRIIVEVSPQTNEMVEREMVGETDDLKHETKELIEALKRRAQAEAESAGTLPARHI
jgi:hypothetical protein